jgi:hypothetical protein
MGNERKMTWEGKVLFLSSENGNENNGQKET